MANNDSEEAYDAGIENAKLLKSIELIASITDDAMLTLTDKELFTIFTDPAHTQMVELSVPRDNFIYYNPPSVEYGVDELQVTINPHRWVQPLELWKPQKQMDLIWKVREEDIGVKRIPKKFRNVLQTSIIHTLTDSGDFDQSIPLRLNIDYPSIPDLGYDVEVGVPAELLYDFVKKCGAKENYVIMTLVFRADMVGGEDDGLALMCYDVDKGPLIDHLIVYSDQFHEYKDIEKWGFDFQPLVSSYTADSLYALISHLDPQTVSGEYITLRFGGSKLNDSNAPLNIETDYKGGCHLFAYVAPSHPGSAGEAVTALEKKIKGKTGADFRYELDGDILYEVAMLKRITDKGDRATLEVMEDHMLVTYMGVGRTSAFKVELDADLFYQYSPNKRDLNNVYSFNPEELWSILKDHKKNTIALDINRDIMALVINVGEDIKDIQLMDGERQWAEGGSPDVILQIDDGTKFKNALSKFRKVDNYEGVLMYADEDYKSAFFSFTNEEEVLAPMQLTYYHGDYSVYEWYAKDGTPFTLEAYDGDLYKSLARVKGSSKITIEFGMKNLLRMSYNVKDYFMIETLIGPFTTDFEYDAVYPSIETISDYSPNTIKEVVEKRNQIDAEKEDGEPEKEEEEAEKEKVPELYKTYKKNIEWRDEAEADALYEWSDVYDSFKVKIDKMFRIADTLEDKLEVLKILRYVAPNVMAYYDRICHPFEDVEEKGGKKLKRSVKCWWDALKADLDKYNSFAEADKQMREYFRLLESVSEEERDELWDEGYKDAKAYLEGGEKIEKQEVDYLLQSEKVYYNRGWNEAIEDFEKGKFEAVDGKAMIDDLSEDEMWEAYDKARQLLITGGTRIGHPSKVADMFLDTQIADINQYSYQDWGPQHARGNKPDTEVAKDVLRWVKAKFGHIWAIVEEIFEEEEEEAEDNLILDDVNLVDHDDFGFGMIYSYSESGDRRRYEINFPEWHEDKTHTNRVWSDKEELSLNKKIPDDEKDDAMKEWYNKWKTGIYPVREEEEPEEDELYPRSEYRQYVKELKEASERTGKDMPPLDYWEWVEAEKETDEVFRGKKRKKLYYTDFDGYTFKDLDIVSKSRQRYHNKHTDDSGNFGYTVIDSKEEHMFTLDGEYDENKRITRLTFSQMGEAGEDILPNVDDTESLKKAVKGGIEAYYERQVTTEKTEEEEELLEKPDITHWVNIYTPTNQHGRISHKLYSYLEAGKFHPKFKQNLDYSFYNRVKLGTEIPLGHELCEKFDIVLYRSDEEPITSIYKMAEFTGLSKDEVAEALQEVSDPSELFETVKKYLKEKKQIRADPDLVEREVQHLMEEAKDYEVEEELDQLREEIIVYHVGVKERLEKYKKEGVKPIRWADIVVDLESIIESGGKQRKEATELLNKIPNYLRQDEVLYAFPDLDMAKSYSDPMKLIFELKVDKDYYLANIKYAVTDVGDYGGSLDDAEQYIDSLIPLSEWEGQYDMAEILINDAIPPKNVRIIREVEEEEPPEKPSRKFNVDDIVKITNFYKIARGRYEPKDGKWKYDLNDIETGKRVKSSVPEEELELKDEEQYIKETEEEIKKRSEEVEEMEMSFSKAMLELVKKGEEEEAEEYIKKRILSEIGAYWKEMTVEVEIGEGGVVEMVGTPREEHSPKYDDDVWFHVGSLVNIEDDMQDFIDETKKLRGLKVSYEDVATPDEIGEMTSKWGEIMQEVTSGEQKKEVKAWVEKGAVETKAEKADRAGFEVPMEEILQEERVYVKEGLQVHHTADIHDAVHAVIAKHLGSAPDKLYDAKHESDLEGYDYVHKMDLTRRASTHGVTGEPIPFEAAGGRVTPSALIADLDEIDEERIEVAILAMPIA